MVQPNVEGRILDMSADPNSSIDDVLRLVKAFFKAFASSCAAGRAIQMARSRNRRGPRRTSAPPSASDAKTSPLVRTRWR